MVPTFRLPHLNVLIYANGVLSPIDAPLPQHQVTPSGMAEESKDYRWLVRCVDMPDSAAKRDEFHPAHSARLKQFKEEHPGVLGECCSRGGGYHDTQTRLP